MLFTEIDLDSIEHMRRFVSLDSYPDNYLAKILDLIEAGHSLYYILHELTKNSPENARSSTCLSLLTCLNCCLNNEPVPYSSEELNYLLGRDGCLASYYDAPTREFHSYMVCDLVKAYGLKDTFSYWFTQGNRR